MVASFKTYPAQRQAVIFAEVRDRLVIRCEPTQQQHDRPRHASLTLRPTRLQLPPRLPDQSGTKRLTVPRFLAGISRLHASAWDPNQTLTVDQFIGRSDDVERRQARPTHCRCNLRKPSIRLRGRDDRGTPKTPRRRPGRTATPGTLSGGFTEDGAARGLLRGCRDVCRRLAPLKNTVAPGAEL